MSVRPFICSHLFRLIGLKLGRLIALITICEAVRKKFPNLGRARGHLVTNIESVNPVSSLIFMLSNGDQTDQTVSTARAHYIECTRSDGSPCREWAILRGLLIVSPSFKPPPKPALGFEILNVSSQMVLQT